MADLMDRLQDALAGRYTLERELGRGGMAVVFLANDLKHSRPVALKVLRPELSDLIGRERFLREIVIAAQLQHPHIVSLYDSGSADGLLFYTMSFVEGETLAARLGREVSLPVDEALRITRQVAEALHHAHTRDVVHRDVKPENIYLSGEHVLVADFGIARAISEAGGTALTARGIAIGTPEYMSPEQASAADRIDGRSDQYSLACTLYKMLAGDPPFTGRTAAGILARHRQEPPPSLRVVRPTVSAAVQETIERALAKIPADRYPTVVAFAEALQHAHRRRWWTRRRAAAAISAATVVVAGAIALWSVAWPPPTAAVAGADLSHLAVLYFDDASPDGSLRWLARGLSEELIDLLGGVPGLTVTSRNGVRPYEGTTVAPDSIGRALDVGLLVDGTVEPAGRRGDSIRVVIRLVDAGSGVRLDGLALARRLDEPLGLKRAVTEDVEQLLRRRIGTHVRVRHDRAAAGNDALWEMVRRARELRDDAITLADNDDTVAAVDRLRRADSLLAAAERDALDWVQPSIDRANLALTNVALWGGGTAVPAGIGRSVADLLVEGARHAERALRRAPDDPQALTAHGELLLRAWNFGGVQGMDSLIPAAYRDLTRATELDPGSARAWYALSDVLLAQGDGAQSRLAGRKALAADVYAAQAPTLLTQLMFAALETGQRAEADSLCTVGGRHYATNPNFIECRMTILGWLGQGGEAVRRAWAEVARLDTIAAVAQIRLPRRLLVAALLARSGMPDSARRVLAATRTLAADERAWRDVAVYEAYVYALLGDADRSVGLLRALVAENPALRDWLAASSWFRGLRDDSAFVRLVRPDG